MHLFLEGSPRVGKSTILKNALSPYQPFVAGFMVQRLFRQGEICGFRACVVDGRGIPALEAPDANGLEGVFLYEGNPIPGVLEHVIFRAGEQCARDACKVILLDEIGGFELRSPAFMQSLDVILRLGKPCIGVLKSRENLARTVRRLNLPDGVFQQNDDLHRRIEENGKVLVVTERNVNSTAKAAGAFIRAVFNEG